MLRLVSLLLLTASLWATDAVGWRGDGSGRFETTIPATLKPAWRVPLAMTCSSPIVIDGRVITLADPDQVICIDAAGGKERWRQTLSAASCATPEQQAWLEKATATPRHDKAAWKQLDKDGKQLFGDIGKPSEHGATAATPATDGTHLWVHFGFGFVACLALADGAPVWVAGHPTGQLPALAHDTSPVLVDGQLLLMGREAITALDAATGKLRWSTKVPKMGHGTATPVVVEAGGMRVIIAPCGTVLDLAGKVLAQVAVAGDQSPAPVAGGVVFASGDGYNREPQVVACFDLADPAAPASRWVTADRRDTKGGTSTMSPLVAGNQVYLIDKSDTPVWIYDLASGKPAVDPLPCRLKIPGHTWRPSPAAATNAIVVPFYPGKVLLLSPDGAGKVLGEFDCGAPLSGSPFCADGHLYLRSHKELLCF